MLFGSWPCVRAKEGGGGVKGEPSRICVLSQVLDCVCDRAPGGEESSLDFFPFLSLCTRC